MCLVSADYFHALKHPRVWNGGVVGVEERTGHGNIHGVSEKNCAKLFLSELCQISINFNNFW